MIQTPAQAAKEYAAFHGFTITPNGRRYTISHKVEINGVPEIWAMDVGGYPAMLNAMRARAITLECVMVDGKYKAPGETAAEFAERADTRDDGACKSCVNDKCTTGNECVTLERDNPNTQPVDRSEPRPYAMTFKDAVQASHYAQAVAEFSAFDVASQARIRKAAKRIERQRRRAAGKPPGGPWHVLFNGDTVMKYGYPSRAAAIAIVRWGFNTSEPFRTNWRNAVVTVEYRAS